MKLKIPEHIDKILLVAVFTTFMGQIYIRPFGTDFRLTFAVIVLNILMLTFKSIPPVPTINLVGVLMLLIRSTVYAFNHQVPLMDALIIYYPVIYFYIFYSLFFVLLDIRGQLHSPPTLFMGIWICDSIPNIIEVLVRNDWKNVDFESAILTIITIGLVRTVFTTLMIYFSVAYYDYLNKRKDYQRFIEKVMLLSNLKTELFFLRKSKKDIELAMEKSFAIYERLEMPENKELMLEVTKDIHEIKKDYTRVINGIEKSIHETSQYQMGYAEIVKMIFAYHTATIDLQGKHIKFIHKIAEDFRTSAFYTLISILNNLIINAIDAIPAKGFISLTQEVSEGHIYIHLSDNGTGIEPEDLQLIFNPGYSTKYNEVNGIMSSGIGLTHVKYLVEHILQGTITATSQPGKGSCFTIVLPYGKLALTPEADPTIFLSSEGANL